MKKIGFIALALFIIFIMPLPQGAVEFLFPSTRIDDPDLSDTLTAPFAAAPEQGEEAPEEEGAEPGLAEQIKPVIPENAIPMEQPHRPAIYIAEWLADVVSESTAFRYGNYQTDLDATEKYFHEAGRAQYLEFLKEKSILKALESGRFYTSSFVEQTPLLLNKGDVGGRYRWLFEVPVMMTYLEGGKAAYDGKEPPTQRFTINIQLGRMNNPKNDFGIEIESWSAKIVGGEESAAP